MTYSHNGTGKRHNANRHNAKRHDANRHNAKKHNTKRHNITAITARFYFSRAPSHPASECIFFKTCMYICNCTNYILQAFFASRGNIVISLPVNTVWLVISRQFTRDPRHSPIRQKNKHSRQAQKILER